jgi:hypothetical protein
MADEDERARLEHIGKLLERFGKQCDLCGRRPANAGTVNFKGNIGLFVQRYKHELKAEICGPCLHTQFLKFTAMNFLLGWWGTISLFVTPAYIVNNFDDYGNAVLRLDDAVKANDGQAEGAEMTQAVCFHCGEMKWGAFNGCENCGSKPKTDDELMLSIMLTDHNLSADKLAYFGRSIKAGQPPLIPESERVKLRPAIEEAKMLLGIKRKVVVPDLAVSSSTKRWFFNSPGLTWPFLAAVAALIILWTLYVGQARFVRQSEVLTYGIVFGLLSGVVLFAIMRAFDRGRTR